MHDTVIYWRYAAMVFFSLSIIFPDKTSALYRILSRSFWPYFLSFFPVALLVYAIYIVFTQL